MAPTQGAVRPALRWACGALAAAIAFLVVSVPMSATAAVRAVEQATLDEARGEADVLRVSLPAGAPDIAAEVPRILIGALAGGRDDALRMHRTVMSAPLPVGGVRSLLLSEETTEGAGLRSGEWPGVSGAVALSEDLAAAAGADVGDTVLVRDRPFAVSGIWGVGPGRDAPWLRRPPDGAGIGAEPVGAAVVSAADLAALSGQDAAVHFTVQLVPGAWETASLSHLPRAWRDVSERLRQAGVAEAELSGGLVPTVLRATERGRIIAATAPVSLGIALLVATALMCALVPALLAAREERRALLWARGAGPGRLIRDAAADLAVPAIAGAVLGTGAAVALRAVGGGVEPALPVVAAAAAVSGAMIAAAALAAAVDWRRRGLLRRRRWGAAGALAALAVWSGLAVLSCWQLLLYGGVGAGGGAAGVDAVAAGAPALAVTTLVGIGAALLWSLRTPVSRVADRSDGALPLLVIRGVFARGSLSLVPVAVCALAAGHLVFAAGYAHTWAEQAAVDARARVGAEVRVSAPGGVSPELQQAVAAVPGVVAAAPVWSRSLSVAAESVTALQVAGPVVAGLAPERDGVDLGGLLEPGEHGLPVTDDVAVRLAGGASSRAQEVQALFLDDFGCLRTAAATVTDAGAEVPVPPACGGRARLVAVDVVLGAGAAGRTALLEVGISAAGGPAQIGGWRVTDPGAAGSRLGEDGVASVTDDPVRVRVSAPAPAAPVPVIASEGFVQASGLEVGDRARMALTDGEETDVRVAGVVAAIPGAGAAAALLVDSRPLLLAELASGTVVPRPASLWVQPEGPAEVVATTLADVLGPGVVIDGTAVGGAQDLLSAAPRNVWLGASGSAVLAVLGMAGVVLARRARSMAEGEGEALRVSGGTSRRSTVAGIAEFALLGASGILVGTLAGLAVVWLLGPALTRGAGAAGLTGPVAPGVDPVPALVGVGILAGAVALASAFAGVPRRRGEDG